MVVLIDIGLDICVDILFCFLMIRRPPRSTLDRSSAASDVYKRQGRHNGREGAGRGVGVAGVLAGTGGAVAKVPLVEDLSLIHISEPTRPY